MQFLNVSQYGREGRWNLAFTKGSSATIVNASQQLNADGPVIEADGALLLPGFTNSHDHLEFNCFPRFGEGRYPSYREWGRSILEKFQDEIRHVQSIPIALRLKWGMYKNLLGGFTTVVNHGEKLDVDDPFIDVQQQFPQLHSVGFEKNWKRKLLNPFRRDLIVMHVGEGTDATASKEIDELIAANIFRRKIVAVHGVAMKIMQAEKFEALVWCPASNDFLFGKTADISSLLGKIRIVFGTDSTLTAGWNSWQHLAAAMRSGQVTEEALLDMLTNQPRQLWAQQDNGDYLLVKNTGKLFQSGIAGLLIVVKRGKILLIDEKLKESNKIANDNLRPISIDGTVKWIYGDLRKLAARIREYYSRLEIPFEYK